MEKATVITLLEKYWQAETTIAEEQALADYIREGPVDPELEAYRELFSYFREEARVSAGPGFGNRILQRLGLPPDEEEDDRAAGRAAETAIGRGAPAPVTPVVPITRRSFRLGVVGAAAAILLVVAGLFLLRPVGQPTMLADNRPAAGHRDTQAVLRTPETQEMQATASARIADTYDDPQQALAAVRRALLVASRNLNQGRREITAPQNKRP